MKGAGPESAMLRALSALLSCLIAASATSAAAQDGLRLEPVVEDLEQPVLVTHAGDGSGRLFVVEQTGRILIVDRGDLLEDPFLDIRDGVGAGGERGLLGLAFHPAYADNRRYFVHYTRAEDGASVVAEFRVSRDPNRSRPAGRALLTVEQPFANHNGGMIAFGPDGFLYIALGDGGSSGDPGNRAQDPDVLLGKILRIDVDGRRPYAIPEDNPFAAGGGRPEIYALGLRNPWRYSFDPATGDLYIGDVGQGEWEEIDFLAAGSPPGANFGWDYFEGSHAYEGSPPDESALIFPILEYSHDGGGCSVTGGHVYRGAELPEFYGVYLFADYCAGSVWGLLAGPDGTWTADLLFGLDGQVTSFGLDAAGELYLTARDGTVYKLVRR
jgi:glucose/arabinose dehydrogenase